MHAQIDKRKRRGNALAAGIALLTILASVVGMVGWRLASEEPEQERTERATIAVPVEVAEIRTETIYRRRGFTGSLIASAESTLAPKVAGRIVSMPLDLADEVRRGDVIATLDSDEYEQLVTQAQAEHAVADANVARATTAAKLASKEFERVRSLHEWGDASDSALDEAEAADAAATAEVRVAEAQRARAGAALNAAEVRLGYTTIRARWTDGGDTRVVSQLFADVGDTVSPNTALATIIELDPIEAVIFVTEIDYAELRPGQLVSVTTDAFPGEVWEGEVARVAPSFEAGSRQARIEVTIPNPEGLLKPGMFVRVEAILGSTENATVVPTSALIEREGKTVIFMVSDDGSTAEMVEVTAGIRDGERLELRGDLSGRVVTLGQHLLDDGSAISVRNDNAVSDGRQPG